MFEVIQSSKYTIKSILKDNWGWFSDKHRGRIRANVLSEVAKVMSCGDIDKLGYSSYECSSCGHRHIVAHTCKSRFCNSCGKKMTDDWIVRAQKSFINSPYHHVIFSPPEELWLFFRNLAGSIGFSISIRQSGG